MTTAPWPVDVRLHQRSRVLEIAFDDGRTFQLPCEFLRVFSPSAEVQGHGPGQRVLQWGKQDVNIVAINPVGNYGVQITFDDGHATGIYTWRALYAFGEDQERLWAGYLEELAAAGKTRSAA